jgi:hypothetical protein
MVAPGPPDALPSNRGLILYFILLGALLPEAITGSTPPLAWLNPLQALMNFWLYGTGVLVVRELSLRWRTGWPGIFLMGAAYGIAEEGLAVRTFFDPTLPMLGDLRWFGRALGVNWVWAVWLTTFHAVVSIGFTIFLIEWHYPAVRGRRLLSNRGLGAAIALFAGAVVFINLVASAFSSYHPGVAEYVGGLAAIAVLFHAAKRGYGRLWSVLPGGRLPSRRTCAAVGFAFMLASFLAYAGGPSLGGVPVLTVLLGLIVLLATLLFLRRFASRPEAERERFAFVAGTIGMFAAFDVVLAAAGNVPMAAVGAAFLAYTLWLYYRRGPARSQPSAAIA